MKENLFKILQIVIPALGAWVVFSMFWLFMAAILEATGDLAGAEFAYKLTIFYQIEKIF